MDTLERIRNLLIERNWTEYKLAKEAGLPQSTISTLFRRNNLPSIPTLEAICGGLGITMSQFFAEQELVELTAEQRAFFNDWAVLSPEDKLLVEQLVKKLKTAK
ncbi:MAG: helix-turn-helix transcriptional regulator [Lawsonibacter sp.]|nr:helix-turn-helix transcriptional regulator [Lawsonibacter sp.]